MKNNTRHTGKLEKVERLKSSANGNPRFLVRVDGWTCSTQPDTQLGYQIQNWWGREVVAEIGTHYGSPQLNNMWLPQSEAEFGYKGGGVRNSITDEG